MSLGKQDIDKLTQTIVDAAEVIKDIKEAKESGDKITLLEGGALAIKHLGKAIRFISSIQEIGEEVVDIESSEANDLIEAIKNIYDPENGDVEFGAELIIKGMIKLKEGIEKIIAATA